MNPPEPFPTPIKHKLKTIGPLRSLLSRLPPGDKTFSRFQKGLSAPVNLKPQYTFTKTINGKSINWTPTGYTTYLPSGDKTFSRFQKGLSAPVNLKPSKPFPTPIIS